MEPIELEPLLYASALSKYPGAPFDDDVVTHACADVRAEAGWHIAPHIVETVLLDSEGGTILDLPTLRLVDVESVEDITDSENPKPIDGWRKTAKGQLYRRGGWPDAGFEAVRVVMRHGYYECPGELHALIAERCQFAAVNSIIGQEATGSESVSYRNERPIGAPQVDRRIARYRVNWSA